MPTLEELLTLETSVWQALLDGDGDSDARLLSQDFLGVYPTGFADRAAHAAQLVDGPTVAWFELHDARVITLTDSAALLVYRADFARPSTTGTPVADAMYISSLWCRRDDCWVNVFSQDTPAASPE